MTLNNIFDRGQTQKSKRQERLVVSFSFYFILTKRDSYSRFEGTGRK